MNIKPFALKLTKTIINQNSPDNKEPIVNYILKGKINLNGKRGKMALPIQPHNLPAVVISKILPKAQALQPFQELVLARSHLIPAFLEQWKRNISTKIRR